jgi:alpha,alpha-trehalase
LFTSIYKTGGITGSTRASTSNFSRRATEAMGLSFGWAPHQVLLWEGLLKYNYKEKAQEMHIVGCG